ncbi:MAG: SDR family NAD(P)-dependent oxidoreductase [Spirochaetaceae bacterium]|nr:SDR family NAD(P)-dependent oxidoreductase [Spirochaetaceae bacterium]
MNKYLKQYEWSNIGAMVRNNKAIPKETDARFDGRLVVITGATSGIGLETARFYASRGADLLCVNRSEERSLKLKAELEGVFKVSCRFHVADFSRLPDVHASAKLLAEIPENIDVLIHNAGVYNTKRRFTPDGIEEVFQVNYLGSFIINHAVKEKLRRQGKARIIHVNSEGHRFALAGVHLDDLGWERHRYTGLKSYGAAKTAQILSMYPLGEYFAGSGVTVNAMHPGDVKTNMGENNGRLYRFFKHRIINPSARDPLLSAQALYYLGVAEELAGITGKFFNFTTEETPAPHALDRDAAREVWAHSLKLGGLG